MKFTQEVQRDFSGGPSGDAAWATHPGGEIVQSLHRQLAEAALGRLAAVVQSHAKPIHLPALFQRTGQQVERAEPFGTIGFGMSNLTVLPAWGSDQLVVGRGCVGAGW